VEDKGIERKKFTLLFAQDKIEKKISQMGRKISADYEGKNPILIGVLKGCIVFLADLIRAISIPVELEFIMASSYTIGRVSNGTVETSEIPETSLAGRHLLIVEGVVDSGKTLSTIIKNLKLKEPASIEIVTLLDKPKCRKVEIEAKYVGFDAGEEFVIGYGLDESQKYRNLPFIGRMIND
jgi:hypoxanthine phosphoribosyltransferase